MRMESDPTFRQLVEAIASLGEEIINVDCSGAPHRLAVSSQGLSALDHEAISEEALAALGGQLPACIRSQKAWATAIEVVGPIPLFMYEGPVAERQRTNAQATQVFGAPLSDEMSSLIVLGCVGADMRRRFLLARLVRDYSSAHSVVRDLAARIGLQIFSGTHQLTEETMIDIKELYALPKVALGPADWTKNELMFLMRTGRPPKDETRRRLLLLELTGQFQIGAEHSRDEVGALLQRFTRKPWALLKALTDEGLVDRRRSSTSTPPRWVWVRTTS